MAGVYRKKCFSLNARITLYTDAHNMSGIWELGLAKGEGPLYFVKPIPRLVSAGVFTCSLNEGWNHWNY